MVASPIAVPALSWRGTASGTASLSAVAIAATVPAPALAYLNRLSDLLFVLARVLNRHAGGSDVQWQQRKNQ